MRIGKEIKKTCIICKKIFYVHPHRKDKAKYCSYNCYWQSLKKSMKNNKRGFANNPPKGAKNHNWKGGKRWSNGYLWILKPNHPRASKQGYVKNTNLVMEKIIGRPIKPDEIVHHINSNRADDSPNNLYLTNRKKHPSFHKEPQF